MKMLIGYDGSRAADAARDDLQRAGLPDDVRAKVISIAEIWMPPPPPPNGGTSVDLVKTTDVGWQRMHDSAARKMLGETEVFSHHAKARLNENFIGWQITSKTKYGSPAQEILAEAECFKPDLIVVGSHGRSGSGRIFLGSISTKVMTEAVCSVRIARGRGRVDSSSTRIIIGFDGSDGAQAAVEQVASRDWIQASNIRLIAATNYILPRAIGRFVPPVADWVSDEMKPVEQWIRKIAEKQVEKLRDAGHRVSLHIFPGNPRQILVEEAQKWNADCIFVGATRYARRVERFPLGSTAAAVAERAHCSVEIVRQIENY